METPTSESKIVTDLRQTKKYADFLQEIGWTTKKINGQYFYIKKIPFLGSAIKLQRAKKIPFETLEKLAKKYRAFQIIVEPDNISLELISDYGYKISNSPFLPTKTLQIDLTNTKEAILSQMKKDARYSIRKSDPLKIIEQKSVKQFRKDWFSVVKYKRHVLPLNHLNAFKKIFKSNMLLLQNSYGTAGGLFLKVNKITYYWIGYTSDKARDTLVQYQIIWNGILWAKKCGAKRFDFEGIYDERFPIKGWQGFTHFKKSFGGHEVTYPGCFVKWRLPL